MSDRVMKEKKGGGLLEREFIEGKKEWDEQQIG